MEDGFFARQEEVDSKHLRELVKMQEKARDEDRRHVERMMSMMLRTMQQMVGVLGGLGHPQGPYFGNYTPYDFSFPPTPTGGTTSSVTPDPEAELEKDSDWPPLQD